MAVVEQLMNAETIRAALQRIAREIRERHASMDDVLIVGIQSGGVAVARDLARELASQSGAELTAAALDTSMHRDDLASRAAAAMHHTDLPDDVDEKFVILVDDVIQSGRTVRAALDALTSFGRPVTTQLAVLVDRGGRELPIQPDYCGQVIHTEADARVVVQLGEPGREAVCVEKS